MLIYKFVFQVASYKILRGWKIVAKIYYLTCAD